MKILVVSDSHQDVRSLNQAIMAEANSDMILHAGDYAKDLHSARTGNAECWCVSGNCDRASGFSPAPQERVVTIGITRILLTHGHSFGVKSTFDRLVEYAVTNQIQTVIFGHTHHALIENRNGVVLINPGSVSNQKSPFASYAVITTDSKGDIIRTQLKRL